MENVVPILTGIFFILFAIRLIRKYRIMEATGLSAEGVIFGLEKSGRYGKTAIIRFQTRDGSWFTEANTNSITSSFTKEGDKVKVLYEELNPGNFIVKTKYTNALLAGFGLAGTGLIILGLLNISGSI